MTSKLLLTDLLCIFNYYFKCIMLWQELCIFYSQKSYFRIKKITENPLGDIVGIAIKTPLFQTPKKVKG